MASAVTMFVIGFAYSAQGIPGVSQMHSFEYTGDLSGRSAYERCLADRAGILGLQDRAPVDVGLVTAAERDVALGLRAALNVVQLQRSALQITCLER